MRSSQEDGGTHVGRLTSWQRLLIIVRTLVEVYLGHNSQSLLWTLRSSRVVI